MKINLTRFFYNPIRSKNKKSNKGLALILAMTTLMLMVFVATEVSKDSTIEFVVNSQEINRIKAFYAARNSLEIALFRIKVYQQVANANLPPSFASQINQIWSFPFAWPLPLASDATIIDKDGVEKVSKEALFQGSYSHSISDEGSKIDINDLGSPSKTLREVTKKQLLNIFESKIENDDSFKEVYQNFNFTELINRIADWMTDKTESDNGGDKKSAFSELGDKFPPNRGFRTIDELRLIPGMNEEFFTLLSPQVTIYGSKAINPNTASESVLKSLDIGLTLESVKEALDRRNDPEKGGPFVGGTSEECRNDFKGFVESKGARLNPEFDKIPFICDKVINFKIEAVGRTGSGPGSVQKKILAYVIDTQKAGAAIKGYLDQEKKEADEAAGITPPQPPAAGPKPNAPAKVTLPKGRPRIVYWSEF